MNRRHFRRRLSFVGASLAGLGFGRGSATQQPPGPPSSPPRSFAGPPRAGAAPSRAAAVSGPPPSGRLRRFGASAAPHRRARAAMSGRTATGAGPAADPYGFRAAGSRSAPGIAGSPAVGDNGQTCGSISTDAGIACAASRTPFAAKAAKRIGEREAAAHRRRRTPRTRFRRSDLSNAPARPRGPETNQRRGKRAGTPAAARGFLPTAPTDVIASIAGFHRP